MKTRAMKKTPADYPQMIFRISKDDKKRISGLVEKITKRSNANLEAGRKRFRKNEVIVDALFLGLLTMERKKLRRIQKP